MIGKKVDALTVMQFDNRRSMGVAAAHAVLGSIQQLLGKQGAVNMVFAAAPSQNEFLAALVESEGVDWTRVNAFHMDEYIGLPVGAPQRFGSFLKEKLFDKLPFRTINYLNGDAKDPQAECHRYADLIKQYPIDITCMGIGENCHIAFNDPHVADFEDPSLVKIVDLDAACRQQQVNDQCFHTLADVPKHALTLTIPALMGADLIYCMVPGHNKADAIRHTLLDEITPMYPSTVLRTHNHAILYVDNDSASNTLKFEI